MNKMILTLKLVLVCFLFSSTSYAQSEIEAGIAALKDTDYNVKLNASEALGNLNDKRAVIPLIAALKDTDEYVRSSAADALGKLDYKL